MKLAVISDVHSNLCALNLAIKDALKEKVDKFIFLGDYITDGACSNEVLDLVKKYGDYIILGNRESYILNYSSEKKEFNNYKPIASTYNILTKENLEYIKTLSKYQLINIDKYKILLIHGNGYKDTTTLIEKIYQQYDFDICLYGHFHIYKNTKFKNKLFISPGSIGQPVDGPFYKYLIIDTKQFNIKLKQFDVSKTYEKLKQEYINSTYYKENKVWCNLILQNIHKGKDCTSAFLDLFYSRLTDEKVDSITFNKLWDDTYNYFQKEKI